MKTTYKLIMTEEEYREALKPYKYWYGDTFLISDKKVPPEFMCPKTASEDPCGNGILYLCMHIAVLDVNGWANHEDWESFRRMILRCSQKFNGLVQRSPNKPDYQSHDDLIVLMFTLQAMSEVGLVGCIWDYCQKEFRGPWYFPFKLKFLYNTQEPGVYHPKAYLGRFLHLRAHFAWCVGQQPSWLEKQVWKYTVNKACDAELSDHTSWVLTCAMVNACRDPELEPIKEKWRKAYYSKFFFNHPLKEDGLFANALEAGHPIGLAFKWKRKI